MELLAKRQRPVLLRRRVLRRAGPAAGAPLLQDAFEGHGVELGLLRRDLLDTRRIDRRIRLGHPEDVHVVLLLLHVDVFLICADKRRENAIVIESLRALGDRPFFSRLTQRERASKTRAVQSV